MKKDRGRGNSLARDRHFNVKVKLLVTKEVFTLKNVYSEMKIKELKSYAEFATGIPVHIQRLSYLDEGELLDHTDIKFNDIIVGAVLHMKVWHTWQTLIEAAATGDMEALLKLGVSDDSDFHTPSSDFMGPRARKQWLKDRAFVALYIASHRGNQKLCEKLIRGGADVNARTPLGRTALHVAAAAGHGKIVDALLENGADINAEDDSGESALTIATKFGHKTCERHLFLFRWQQRAKDMEPLPEHEMFAHQYHDSATPVWLNGPQAQIYYTQILPPGEYEGTALNAPKRKEHAPKRYSPCGEEDAASETNEDVWPGMEGSQDFDAFQQSLPAQSRKPGTMQKMSAMPAIHEESSTSVNSSRHPHSYGDRGDLPPVRSSKTPSKQKAKVPSYDQWLSRKEQAEQTEKERKRYERQMRRQAQEDKRWHEEMERVSNQYLQAEKEAAAKLLPGHHARKAPLMKRTSQLKKSSGVPATNSKSMEEIVRSMSNHSRDAEFDISDTGPPTRRFNSLRNQGRYQRMPFKFWMEATPSQLYQQVLSKGTNLLPLQN